MGASCFSPYCSRDGTTHITRIHTFRSTFVLLMGCLHGQVSPTTGLAVQLAGDPGEVVEIAFSEEGTVIAAQCTLSKAGVLPSSPLPDLSLSGACTSSILTNPICA